MRGGDKLLERIDGVDLISLVTGRALATGAPVFVTVPTDSHERTRALAARPVTLVPVHDAASGMAASLRAGVRSLPEGVQGVLVLPADMPEVTTEDLNLMLTHFAELGARHPLRATDAAGRRGNPVILPARLFARLARLRGDTGARVLLDGENTCFIRLPDDHATTDLDTPEDWIAWRARDAIRRNRR